jgi:hypothetical protein
MCEVHAPIPPLQQEGLGTESHPYPHARTRSSWITSKKIPCSLPKMPATPLLKMATVRPCLCVVGPHDWITLCSFTLFLCVGQLRPGAVAPKDKAAAQPSIVIVFFPGAEGILVTPVVSTELSLPHI